MNYEDRVTKEYVEGLLDGRIEIGSYVGDGVVGRKITLSGTPKLLFVSGWMAKQTPLATLVFGMYGHSFQYSNSVIGTNGIAIQEGGFTVESRHNVNGCEEHYIAIY